MREETKRAEPIVESHDHGTLGRQVLTIVPGEAAGTAGETAAVDPDHHGTAVIGVVGACPDVGVEAVFTAGRLARSCCSSGSRRRTRSRRGRPTPAAPPPRSGGTPRQGGSARHRPAP